MEELHDAIEDAQYVSAISTNDGPRPIVVWNVPTEEEMELWKKTTLEKNPDAYTLEWYLANPVGFFLFAQYIKSTFDDYFRINFMEYVAKYRQYPGRTRSSVARKLATLYLTTHESTPVAANGGGEEGEEKREHQQEHLPPKKEIIIEDVYVQRKTTVWEDDVLSGLVKELEDPTYETCCIGLKGNKVEEVIQKSCRKPLAMSVSTNAADSKSAKSKWGAVTYSGLFPENLFDELEIVVFEALKKQYWGGFQESDDCDRALKLLWYCDRKVVKDDFYKMRVLGRGGFGLVTACKKGTSGKLYAMKVMNKKRIKIKKSEQLTLNERNALAVVYSPFVIGLNYSLQTKNNVYLILDLMTGGDLSFHLSQKGIFSKDETLYYSARIMLGLQAMHENGFVYRDLKPENCLLDEDGKVKITDLGLAVKVTPRLQGAAGTRGYWAPEMLRRDKEGKRIPYNHAVDWFSFGCLMAEFISGINPFRSEEALKFGMDKGKTSKKAIDCATLEMDPPLDPGKFEPDALDLCRQFLNKDPATRLGTKGCDAIKAHPFFQPLDWERVITDRMIPPFRPAKDVNAASQSEIGNFAEDKKYHDTTLEEKDQEVYKHWDYINPHAYPTEIIEFLVYERELGKPLLPSNVGNSCCCTII